jgi:hypothetical protein
VNASISEAAAYTVRVREVFDRPRQAPKINDNNITNEINLRMRIGVNLPGQKEGRFSGRPSGGL